MSDALPVIAILGGTGDLGTGLARRWVEAGYEVIIGSRTQKKAELAVNNLQAIMQKRRIESIAVRAMDNASAAECAHR